MLAPEISLPGADGGIIGVIVDVFVNLVRFEIVTIIIISLFICLFAARSVFISAVLGRWGGRLVVVTGFVGNLPGFLNIQVRRVTYDVGFKVLCNGRYQSRKLFDASNWNVKKIGKRNSLFVYFQEQVVEAIDFWIDTIFKEGSVP